MTTSTMTSPCGCGQGAGASVCDCGGKGCDKCRHSGPKRSRFFSGQLLSDGDLQNVSNYVLTKNRLHNRYLHGAGVVCGLQVVCHPCDPGKVIVQPGAALDCCGNDIVLPCAVELDINGMIRDLRLDKLGPYDCGDPCEQECEDSPNIVRCRERKGRRYCLYLRYCENLTDPVTPYTADPACGAQSCEATRVAEGFEFELRCATEDPEEPSIWDAVRGCLGNLTEANQATGNVQAAAAYEQRRPQIDSALRTGRVPQFTATDRSALVDAKGTLDRFDGAMELIERRLRKVLDAYQTAAAGVVYWDLQTVEDKELAEKGLDGVGQDIGAARERVLAMGPELAALSKTTLESQRDKIIAKTWIEQGAQFAALSQDSQVFSARKVEYAYLAPTSPALASQLTRDLSRLREWLLSRLEDKPLFSDCKLRRDVLRIEIPPAGNQDQAAINRATRQLVEALLRYLIDCICAALQPPCNTCDDPAVKLACLEVADCEVDRICNLERTYVWSGPAFRYWLPFLRSIGDLFERVCCEARIKIKMPVPEVEPGGQVPSVEIGRQQSYMSQTLPTYQKLTGDVQLDSLFSVAGIQEADVSRVVNLGGNLANAFSLGTGVTLPETGVDTATLQLNVREVLLQDVDKEIQLVREEVQVLAKREPESVEVVDKELKRELRNVNDRVDRRITLNQLEESDLFKALAARAEQLELRLAKLEKGGEQ